MQYRLATVEDAKTLAEMRWEFRQEEAHGTAVHSKEEFLQACTEFIQQGITGDNWHFWVADDKGTLFSHVCILTIGKIPKPNRLHDTFGYVTNVYTRPAWRNQGIGSELMRYVVEWAKTIDMENLIVWPGERSIPFYQRTGFTAEAEAMNFTLRAEVL